MRLILFRACSPSLSLSQEEFLGHGVFYAYHSGSRIEIRSSILVFFFSPAKFVTSQVPCEFYVFWSSQRVWSQIRMMREYRYNMLKKKFNVYTASLLLFFCRFFWTETMSSHGCLLFCLNKQLMRWCATWKITILILKKKAECEMDAMVEHITLKMFLVSLGHALRIILISMVCFGSQISFKIDRT